METNELRLGNYVKNIDGVKLRVTGIEQHVINSENEKIKYIATCNFYKPLPITENILINFSFQKSFDWYMQFENIEIFYENNNIEIFSSIYTESPVPIYVSCRYVHQLQNILYFFTGKELEIEN